MQKLLFSVVVALWLVGCSSVPVSAPVVQVSADAVDMGNHAEVRTQLLEQLEEWQGVPYRYGGLSKQGVDCSGFIYLTFAEEFGIRLPRTTQSQVLKGAVVDQSDLLPGDLIFFQTGYDQRHIGIYVGKKQFIHTSSSRGVMLSRLDNPYWQSAYWHSRRVAL
jgi:cell wall-associated NlpC family hydrolase|tara:strand:- start:5247 stop:5735 length:489 start_codon:yes stop_codon:yes gene_type:complete